MHQLYGLPQDDTKAMETFAREKFGVYGGIAQQYLFNYAIKKSIVKWLCKLIGEFILQFEGIPYNLMEMVWNASFF